MSNIEPQFHIHASSHSMSNRVARKLSVSYVAHYPDGVDCDHPAAAARSWPPLYREGQEVERVFKGREAWLLDRLIRAGQGGITNLEAMAPRTSHYLLKCRRAGVAVETEREGHSGPFKGSHGRFRIITPVTVHDGEWA